MTFDYEEPSHPSFSPGLSIAVSELDAFSDDLRRKQGSRSGKHGAVQVAAPTAILDEEQKLNLALRTSEATMPGAVHYDTEEPSSVRAKPTQFSQLAVFARLRRNPKEEFRGPARHKQDDKNMTDFTNNTSAATMDEDFQTRMHEFKKHNNHAADEDEERKRRRKRCIIIVVVVGALIMIGGIITGIVIGINGGYKAASPSAAPTVRQGDIETVEITNQDCLPLIQEDAALLERYELIQSVIVSEYPSMAEAIANPDSSARSALCWITDQDAMYIQVDLGYEFNVIQRFALALLYFRFSEQVSVPNDLVRSSNWLTPQPVCEWEGVTCAGSSDEREVSGLHLSDKGLRGGIPSELTLLRNLTLLNFRDNPGSRSTIPSELWTLTKLELLAIDDTGIFGTLSSDISNLSHLQHFSASRNQLSGSIPDLSALSKLSYVSLLHTYLNGTIPRFSEDANMVFLELSDTSLSGSIPTILGSLTRLTHLGVGKFSSLEGTIPSEFGMLTQLVQLDLSSLSQVSGTIPTELGKLTLLQHMSMDSMIRLTGSVPSELGQLTHLQDLRFGGTPGLTGSMPSEVCRLRSLSLTRLEHWCNDCSSECPEL